MQFQGDHIFPMLPEALFKLLSDARFLVSCLPDATNVKLASADEAHCTVRPNFSFSAGTLDVTLRVLDRQPPTSVRFHITNKAIGAGAEIESALQLSSFEDGTRVEYQSTIIKLTGLLKLVPSGLLRGAARQAIDQVWNHIGQRVVQEAASQPAV